MFERFWRMCAGGLYLRQCASEFPVILAPLAGLAAVSRTAAVAGQRSK